ncbi:MAG: PEGA domain-containing protein [Chloroflexota bacterium]|nr:PEGA domain-containing protein [Chloroflexota bacterium]
MLPACATVTRGTQTAWEVQSDPPGAQVTTSHGYQCPGTPCSIKMPRKSQFTATVSKPGYTTATMAVTNKIGSGGGTAMAGNIVVGGIIGAGVDAASGAMYDLTPNPLIVKLEPVAIAPVQSGYRTGGGSRAEPAVASPRTDPGSRKTRRSPVRPSAKTQGPNGAQPKKKRPSQPVRKPFPQPVPAPR